MRMPKRDVLEVLFGSNTRVRLLRLFLANPNEIFDHKTIVKRLGANSALLARETRLLESIGYIKQSTRVSSVKFGVGKKIVKKRIRGLCLSRDFPYVKELAAFFASVAPSAREKILHGAKSIGRVSLLIIAGSLIGQDTSRVDVFIVGDLFKKARIERMLRSVEMDIGKEVVYAIMPTKEFQYRYGMYDRFIKDLFDHPHEILVNKLGIG